jgi:hypothetical protein
MIYRVFDAKMGGSGQEKMPGFGRGHKKETPMVGRIKKAKITLYPAPEYPVVPGS